MDTEWMAECSAEERYNKTTELFAELNVVVS